MNSAPIGRFCGTAESTRIRELSNACSIESFLLGKAAVRSRHENDYLHNDVLRRDMLCAGPASDPDCPTDYSTRRLWTDFREGRGKNDCGPIGSQIRQQSYRLRCISKSW